jgi:DNA-binding transcriptional regulator YiaG
MDLPSSKLLPKDPPRMSKSRVQLIRAQILRVSEGALARFLGVSEITVRGWEIGLSEPSGPASRLLEIAECAPEEFMKLVLNCSEQSTVR